MLVHNVRGLNGMIHGISYKIILGGLVDSFLHFVITGFLYA